MTRREAWIGSAIAALALVAFAIALLRTTNAPIALPATDVAMRTDAYHYCERRLIASLPKETDLNVRAFRRGRRSATELSDDLVRVIGYFDGRLFGAESHGEYRCLVRHAGNHDFALVELKMHREPAYPHK